MASLALGVKFNPTLGGLTDWVYSSAVTGYVGPAATSPAMVDGKTYRYRAESADLTQWEFGSGPYTASTQTIARTTITLSSTGAKVNFTVAPFVGVVPFPVDILQFDDAMSLTAAQQDQGRANLAIVGRNKIINGGFTINQRAYVSAAALASAAFGHDRWKAGASGGDYSFTQLTSPTTITIAASKSLIQIVEDKNVEGGSYILSWTGTATARVTINSATPAGNFAVSPITVTGQTAGTTMSVEFTGANAAGTSAVATNTGTLGLVQLELGTKATPFEFRPYSVEQILCFRYFRMITNPKFMGIAGSTSGPSRMGMTVTPSFRIGPALTMTGNLPLFFGGNGTIGTTTLTTISTNYSTVDNLEFDATSPAVLTIGYPVMIYQTGTATLAANAEI